MDEQRALLDQLLGSERDVPQDQRKNTKRHFSDREVCKYALCGCSPYELFSNTKSDLGAYNKVRPTQAMIDEWNALSEREKDR